MQESYSLQGGFLTDWLDRLPDSGLWSLLGRLRQSCDGLYHQAQQLCRPRPPVLHPEVSSLARTYSWKLVSGDID
ncbi:hypothetical protein DSO57_1014775 [Entomophthora muscae]|uniref:Uncharacterized protein n=1 Tax=Entomophthora muscae TaxID=34485 RepID=A0ACC2UF58_9FUNG|nr:hypothetical protein DSO57_1014775 [Entomophthora muscae]